MVYAKLETVLDFGQIVKRAVEKEGMLGWQFNTIGVSDAITMGGDGKHCATPKSPKWHKD